MKITKLIPLFLTLIAGTAQAIPVCSTGSDGTISISNPATRVNVYFAAPDPTIADTTVSAGATSVPIDEMLGAQSSGLHPSINTSITAGDVLLVLQMMGAPIDTTDNHLSTGSYGDGAGGAFDQAGNLSGPDFTVGRYEFVVATGPIAGGAIPIEGAGAGNGLLNNYVNSNSTAGALGFRRYQIVKVPQLSRLTVTGEIVSERWNGRWGGISAVNVRDTLSLNGGSFNADGRGFRGGQFFRETSIASGGNFGFKGEGIAGMPQRLFSRVLLAEQPASNGEELGPAGYPGADGGGGAGTAWTRDTGLGAPSTLR